LSAFKVTEEFVVEGFVTILLSVIAVEKFYVTI
jgi:hypothetical protein